MLMDEAPNSKDFEELVEIALRSRWREFAKEKCSEQFNPVRTRAPIGEPNLTEERGGNHVGTRDRTLFKVHTHNVPKVMNKNLLTTVHGEAMRPPTGDAGGPHVTCG